jgi:hypothetical protein
VLQLSQVIRGLVAVRLGQRRLAGEVGEQERLRLRAVAHPCD